MSHDREPLPSRRVAGPYLFPAEYFPITMRAYGIDSGSEVWHRVIPTPHRLSAVRVPPLARLHGEPVRIEVEFADGSIIRESPMRD